jgi:hypothetical protein
LEDGSPGAVDALDGVAGAEELVGLEDGRELREFELVDLAQIERGEGWVEEVLEELAGEFVRRFVRVHVRIFAHRRSGTRGDWGRMGSLRTGRGDGDCICWLWERTCR